MATQETVEEQYKRPQNLEARISLHERFSTNRHGWQRWVFDQFEFPRASRVLELGCGVGKLWLDNSDRLSNDWDVTLSDFSPGMLKKTTQNLADSGLQFTYRVINATEIPYPTAAFDGVIANHMLYYVDDKSQAYAEMRRVLIPSGRLYAATVGSEHMKELRDLVAAFDPSIPFGDGRADSFLLENALDQVVEWFSDVELRCYVDSLVVTDEDALIDYVFSSTSVFNLPRETKADLAGFIRQRVAAQGGVFQITKDSGMICAKRS
jgi:SAM-dependent methyltransferase